MNEDILNLALDNAALDEDGWALIAPFGEHPKERLYREAGQTKTQRYLQVLDNDSADQLMSEEHGLFRRLRRAVVGIPVFKGHGDLNDVDPKAIGNETRKIKLGVVDKIRKTAAGIEAHFALDNDGAEAVAGGWKLPSALWMVKPCGTDADGTIRCRPFKLISVALTQWPNIKNVQALDNATPPVPESENKQTQTTMLREQIIGALIGKGLALPNDITDTQIVQTIANGDFPGHPFRGNQYAGGSEEGPEHAASKGAHYASGAAKDKVGHTVAAKSHESAAKLHEQAGRTDAAEMHRAMAKYHTGRAARFKK